MSEKRLKPIPVPAWKLWMEFRYKYVPALLFFAALFVVAWLWDFHLTSHSLVGQVQVMRLDIQTPSTGTITNMTVELFQEVHAGDIIAKLDPANPLTDSEGRIDMLLAKQELLQLMNLSTAASTFDIQRNVLDKERLRTELMGQKVQLASARVRLQNLENEYRRSQSLHEQKLLSDSEFDLAEKSYLGSKAEVEERQHFIDDLGNTIEQIETLIKGAKEIEEAKLAMDRTSLERSIAKMAQEWIIRAPVDGMITSIQKRSGEMVRPSDPIVTLTPSSSDKVIAYIPQGTEYPVHVGQKVTIKSRTQEVRSCVATVVRVGTSFEPINDQLSLIQMYKVGGVGRPLLIQLPSDFSCTPGEIVNIGLTPLPSEGKPPKLASR